MALLNVGPSLSERDTSLDLPLAGLVPFSNFTDSSGSSPRDFDLLEGVFAPTPSLYFLKFRATSLLTILLRTVLEMFERGCPRASLIYYLTLIVEKFTVSPFLQHRVAGGIHFKVTLDSLNVKLGEGEDFGELTAL